VDARRSMAMTRSLIPVLAAVLLVAACDRQTVNPPTEPAQPVTSAEVAPAALAPEGVGPSLPGAGPASFVGRWAANPAWCANTTGAETPITITPLRFEGYENSCAITSLDQVSDGYEVALSCQAEGEASHERVRLSRQEDVLRLTWLNRNDAVVLLVRCPAEAGPPPAP
jgi:hypothetical protein